MHCEHHVDGDDENFLLDDENTSVRKCIGCRLQGNRTDSGTVLNVNGFGRGSRLVIMDHMENLEDAPLLINECTEDEFHCHNVLVQNDDKRAWKKLMWALALCFVFMITELVGGLIAGSLAVMTDAAHLFSDFVGFLISLLSIWVARKPSTKNMTFGYHRAEVLGAFLSVLSIWLLAIIFAALAINRMWKKDYDIDANTMLVVSSLGVLVNLVMGAVLYGFCHNHSHGLGAHSHESSHDSNNINVRAAAAHVLGDLLQSLGVLVAAVVIKIFPDAQLADPICTLIFTIVVFFTTVKVARDSLWMLLEGSPRAITELAFELQNVSNVRHLHNLHIWSLAPGKDVVAVHLCVDKYCDRDVVIKRATSILKNKLSIMSCTIQVEAYNAELISSCRHCQPVHW